MQSSIVSILDSFYAGLYDTPKYTITQKMADQGWSDLDVVFTIILCAANFFEASVHKLTSDSFWEHAHLISKPYDLK